MTDERERYAFYLANTHKKKENICTQCGECCGAYDGDPCEHLLYDESRNIYLCSIYAMRLGSRRTISGKKFTCVPIADIIKKGMLRPQCAYAIHNEVLK